VRAARRRWEDPVGRWVGDLRDRAWQADKRAGEGLAWPQGLEGFCRRHEEGMWRERLSVSRSAARYLVKIVEGARDGVIGWEPREFDWVSPSSFLSGRC
jgi:hypothetical protein